MKRFFSFFFLFFFGISVSFAHPLDVSLSLFYFKEGGKTFEASTYFHPFEVGVLLESKGIKTKKLQEVFNYEDIFFQAVRDNVALSNNSEACELSGFSLPKQKDFQIFSDGLEVQYLISCLEPLQEIQFVNTLFIDQFDLQTNKMLFFNRSTENSDPTFQKILTAKIAQARFDVRDPLKIFDSTLDTDKDGLPDEQEKIYGTEIEIPDTDFDGYSDFEETEGGWPALDPVKSMGQRQLVDPKIAKEKYIEYIQKTSAGKTTQELQASLTSAPATIETQSEREQLRQQIQKENPSATLSGSPILGEALEFLGNFLEDTSILGLLKVLLVVFILGTLHALQPGHGKSIFLAYLLEHKRSVSDVLKYSSSLTVTHLLDVLVIGTLIYVFSAWANVSLYITWFQRVGAIGLFIVSLYVLYSAYKNYVGKSESSIKSKQSSAMLGILAGLTPCTYGWAILMTILAVGKMQWIFPILIGFGFGIWFTVTGVGVLIVRFRNAASSRIKVFAKYSAFASGFLLLFFAIQLLLFVF